MTRFLVAGVDGGPAGERAARWAAEEAMRMGDELRLVGAHSAAGRALAATADRLRIDFPALAVRTALWEDEQASTALLEEVAAPEAEMVVLGAGPGVPGSTTRRVVTHAACPVVLVRPGGAPAGPVVVGIDGERALAATEFALEHARRKGIDAVVLHAWTSPQRASYFSEPPSAADIAGESRAIHEELVLLLAPLLDRFADVRTSVRVERGGASGLLLKEAEKASLLVLGRTAPGPRYRPRLGSVPHGVIPLAACPVAVVPHG